MQAIPTLLPGRLVVRRKTGFRADIQSLRALAVSAVVLYHFFPGVVRGGYVGVDVFFVISGFLITSHLGREALTTHRVILHRFWLRRARRLLPAAFLVLLVSSLLVFQFVPDSLWPRFISQAFASTFYYENWALVADSTNYLAQGAAPTAVQHYWSLSVEEQFYVVWPLLFLLALYLSKRRRLNFPGYVLPALLAIVTVVSLSYSIWSVSAAQPSAYFSTASRAWEFGVGGLLAYGMKYLSGLPRALAAVAIPLGWLLIGCAVLLFTKDTPFPGWTALLPVVGTVVVIAAGSIDAQPRVVAVITARPIVWLGSISYSFYLWHWPLVVIAPFVLGIVPTLPVKLALIAGAVVLAWLTSKYVERPFMTSPRLDRLAPVAVASVMIILAVVSLAPTIASAASLSSRLSSESALRGKLSQSPCFGDGTLRDFATCGTKDWPLLSPDPALASDDVPAIYPNGLNCISDTAALKRCNFGDPASPVRVALVGDSHAAQWFPAIRQIAKERGWYLQIFMKFSCTFSDAKRSETYSACTRWSHSLSAYIATHRRFTTIYVSSYADDLDADIHSGVLTPRVASEGFKAVWSPIISAGTRIVVMRDTPTMTSDVVTCVARYSRDTARCARPRPDALSAPDYQFTTARGVSGVEPLDMTDGFCRATMCPASAGGVVIYLDGTHMTATWSKSLVGLLGERLGADGGIRK